MWNDCHYSEKIYFASFLVINVSPDNWPILRDRMQANNMFNDIIFNDY